jgi:hypothetical protein
VTEAWSKFITAIDTAKHDLECEHSGAWFRGVGSCRHRLYPSLLRPRTTASRRRELKIYEEFIDFDQDADNSINSWERLVRLQHYGVPTRLLDWTEVLGVALYFALRSYDGRSNAMPAIWIINPFQLSTRARRTNDRTIASFHCDADMDYFRLFLQNKKLQWPYHCPIPYRPPKLTHRIRAQKGFFTIHGLDNRPLDAIAPKLVRQVRLPREAIVDAKKFLNLSGIDSLSMFPDYEGFARRIKDRYE